MAQQVPWEQRLFDYVNRNVNPTQNLINFTTPLELPFNPTQQGAVNSIFYPVDDVPQTTSDRRPHPRIDNIPHEQLNTFRPPANYHISRLVVPSTLIIGPPGTGKTRIICSGSILRMFNPENLIRTHPRRVLIGTFSNAGSYRIYEQFHNIANMANTPEYFQRIKLVQADTAREKHAFHNLQHTLNLNPDDYTINNRCDDRILLNESLIFVGTTDSLAILSTANPHPSVHGVIYDEASQLTVPHFFQLFDPGQAIRSICVVGDDAQLPPVATLAPLGVSALSYLQGLNAYQNTPIPQNRIIELERQYRMHPTIAQLTQRIVRAPRNVIPDGPTIQPNYLLDPQNYNLANLTNPLTLGQTTIDFLDNILRPEHPLVIIDTSEIPQATDERIGRSRMNKVEAELVVGIYNALRQSYPYLENEDIILTTPYRRQVDIFRENNVRSGTVHQYQGQEALIVLYSLTYARPNTKSDFFTQHELMYVGLSRAQRKLIIFGNQDAMNHPDPAIQLVRDTIFNFQYVNGGQGYPPYNINPVSNQRIDVQFLNDIRNNLL